MRFMALGIYWATALLCVFVGMLFLDIMGFFSSKNQFEVDSKTVIITGGSQGMGRGLARLLAQKGANVVIVARNKQRLEDAVKYISSHARRPDTQRFLAISAELTRPEENARLLEEVTAWNSGAPPDIVWANAGSSHPTLFIDTEVETLRSQMETNYWAAAYLAHATLKAWLKPSSGLAQPGPAAPRHFVMTSSVVCFVGIAGYAPYAPAKAAIRTLADTLCNEVNLYNGYRRTNPVSGPAADVKIHCVVPGTILSPGFEEEEKVKHAITKELEKDDPKQTEDQIAASAIKQLEQGHYLITTQLLAHALRAGALGGSPRNGLGVLDTMFSWVMSIAWLFIRPDLDRKVWIYGKQNKVNLPAH